MDQAGELLQQLGLSRNEARAYMALLGCQPATAYEVSKRSSVPSSKVYETLNRLVTRGIVRPADKGTDVGKHYVALPPAEFMQQLREATAEQTQVLEPLLDAIGSVTPGDYIWPLTGTAHLRAKASELIVNAAETILISCWPDELAWLTPMLEEADSRSIRIALIHFGLPRHTIGATYHHPDEQIPYAEKRGRGLTLVVDGVAVLIANFRAAGALDAAWSRNHAFVTVAEDSIRQAIYITKVTRLLGDELPDRFGEHYEPLRDVFNADA